MGHKMNAPIQLGISDFYLQTFPHASTVLGSNEKQEMDLRILGSFFSEEISKIQSPFNLIAVWEQISLVEIFHYFSFSSAGFISDFSFLCVSESLVQTGDSSDTMMQDEVSCSGGTRRPGECVSEYAFVFVCVQSHVGGNASLNAGHSWKPPEHEARHNLELPL